MKNNEIELLNILLGNGRLTKSSRKHLFNLTSSEINDTLTFEAILALQIAQFELSGALYTIDIILTKIERDSQKTNTMKPILLGARSSIIELLREGEIEDIKILDELFQNLCLDLKYAVAADNLTSKINASFIQAANILNQKTVLDKYNAPLRVRGEISAWYKKTRNNIAAEKFSDEEKRLLGQIIRSESDEIYRKFISSDLRTKHISDFRFWKAIANRFNDRGIKIHEKFTRSKNRTWKIKLPAEIRNHSQPLRIAARFLKALGGQQILISTLPKSASTALFNQVKNLKWAIPIKIFANTPKKLASHSNCDLINEFGLGAYITREHFFPSAVVGSVKAAVEKRGIHVHFRNPIDACFSWSEYRKAELLSFEVSYGFLRNDALEMAEKRADPTNYYVQKMAPIFFDYIEAWLEADHCNDWDIFFTTYEEMLIDKNSFQAKIEQHYRGNFSFIRKKINDKASWNKRRMNSRKLDISDLSEESIRVLNSCIENNPHTVKWYQLKKIPI